jgi:hypothetical protein
MRVDADEERTGDAMGRPVQANRLRDGEDVVFVERAIE